MHLAQVMGEGQILNVIEYTAEVPQKGMGEANSTIWRHYNGNTAYRTHGLGATPLCRTYVMYQCGVNFKRMLMCLTQRVDA